MNENDHIKLLVRRMDLLGEMFRDIEVTFNEMRDILEKVINWNQGVFSNDQVDLIRQLILTMRGGTPEGFFPLDWTFESYTGGMDEMRRRLTRLEFLLTEDQVRDGEAMKRAESEAQHKGDALGTLQKWSKKQ